MICPRCNRDVSTVYGNGEHPDGDYRCGYCVDKDNGWVVGMFFAIVGAIAVGCVVIELVLRLFR